MKNKILSYIPHILTLGMLVFTVTHQTWLNFALFAVLSAYSVYSEVILRLAVQNDLNDKMKRLEADIQIMNERTLNMQTNLTQIRMTRGLK